MSNVYWLMIWNGSRAHRLSKHFTLADAKMEKRNQLKRREYGYTMIDRQREWVAQYPIIHIVKMSENKIVG